MQTAGSQTTGLEKAKFEKGDGQKGTAKILSQRVETAFMTFDDLL